VKILDLLKGGMFLAEVEWWHYGKNESSIHSTRLNSMHPECAWFLLNGGSPWNPKDQQGCTMY
jgi:hypothetical protein